MCDEKCITTCADKYMQDITTRLLEGITYVCSGRDLIRNTLFNCITERSAGCTSEVLRKALEYQSDSLHKNMFEMIDSVYCSPTEKCGILNSIHCYDMVIKRLNIRVPKDRRKTAEFIDSLLPALYDNQDAYCSVTSADADFKQMAKCLNDEYKKLFDTCINDNKASAAVIKDQSENIFHSTLGQLTNPDYMEASRSGICKRECPQFEDRYRGMKLCAKHYNTDVRYMFDSGTYILENNCHFLQNYSKCVHNNIQACPGLANQLRSHRDISTSLTKCGLEISDAIFVLASPFIIVVSLTLLYIQSSTL